MLAIVAMPSSHRGWRWKRKSRDPISSLQSLSLPRREGGLPVAAVEEAHRLHRRRIEIIEAAGIDAVLVRVGARHVEGVDAASRAEGMLRGAGVEPIGRHLSFAAQQREIFGGHGNV